MTKVVVRNPFPVIDRDSFLTPFDKMFDQIVEASFLVEFRNFEQLNKAKIALQELDDSLKFSFLDSKGMY